ncbi:hypothetical protein BIY24_04475 [Halobacteriovorax marinus]|uniref:Heavy-metal-associated protein n=1 Tax=Halobacteriovorax marinus (strain ATCC BAA-682 / DSM 15412 / SJ) TaxID=862908 RepID=E1WXN1_HALMS|nr:heavy metal-associated domain-containing protein [Halobacteriovorax marinus]ATH07217.1 hypothetical protein BIY24_04475 [Halobacteriovorax marinus]CBW25837.1 putative heavy-metal-associated protein [Halobacteriovorax marinus SJ]
MKKIGFMVEGMKCGGCKSKIENALLGSDMATNVTIDLEEKTVILECSDDASTVDTKNAIEELGFSITKSLRV